MADIENMSQSSAVAFMVAAGLVYEIIAAACSSPQTAEINAAKRSDTLMKWVKVGIAQAALFIVIAACMERKKAVPIISGATLATVIMGACYYHANVSGLRNGGEGTEQY
jgi:hypothetical protein